MYGNKESIPHEKGIFSSVFVSRLRRMLAPSFTGLESTTLLSANPQAGQFINTFPPKEKFTVESITHFFAFVKTLHNILCQIFRYLQIFSTFRGFYEINSCVPFVFRWLFPRFYDKIEAKKGKCLWPKQNAKPKIILCPPQPFTRHCAGWTCSPLPCATQLCAWNPPLRRIPIW